MYSEQKRNIKTDSITYYRLNYRLYMAVYKITSTAIKSFAYTGSRPTVRGIFYMKAKPFLFLRTIKRAKSSDSPPAFSSQ